MDEVVELGFVLGDEVDSPEAVGGDISLGGLGLTERICMMLRFKGMEVRRKRGLTQYRCS